MTFGRSSRTFVGNVSFVYYFSWLEVKDVVIYFHVNDSGSVTMSSKWPHIQVTWQLHFDFSVAVSTDLNNVASPIFTQVRDNNFLVRPILQKSRPRTLVGGGSTASLQRPETVHTTPTDLVLTRVHSRRRSLVLSRSKFGVVRCPSWSGLPTSYTGVGGSQWVSRGSAEDEIRKGNERPCLQRRRLETQEWFLFSPVPLPT